MRATGRPSIAGVLLLPLMGIARSVAADEPVAAREPRMMSETAEITSVVDAFDEDDPFDLNLVLGFSQSWKHASIRRETHIAQPGLETGGFVPATENIASYSSSMSIAELTLAVTACGAIVSMSSLQMSMAPCGAPFNSSKRRIFALQATRRYEIS